MVSKLLIGYREYRENSKLSLLILIEQEKNNSYYKTSIKLIHKRLNNKFVYYFNITGRDLLKKKIL